MLDNQTTQPSKFKTKNWVEINNQSNRTCGPNSQIKFNPNLVRLLKASFRGGARGGGAKKLETWNFVHKYIHICSFRKYTF